VDTKFCISDLQTIYSLAVAHLVELTPECIAARAWSALCSKMRRMAQEIRRFLRVLVASPSDTIEERAVITKVIPELNKLHGAMEGFNLEGLLWETDSYPGLGVDAQDVLNRQLADYDIFVGIMNSRFGTPTRRGDSGTEEEFDRALDRYLI